MVVYYCAARPYAAIIKHNWDLVLNWWSSRLVSIEVEQRVYYRSSERYI
jgi:hypothetical protein